VVPSHHPHPYCTLFAPHKQVLMVVGGAGGPQASSVVYVIIAVCHCHCYSICYPPHEARGGWCAIMTWQCWHGGHFITWQHCHGVVSYELLILRELQYRT
jgi:hypothetical protein